MTRYIEHDKLQQPPEADAEAELLASLNAIVTTDPPQATYGSHDLQGLYAGPTSVAFLFFHLSRVRPDLLVSGKSPAQLCQDYLQHPVPQGPITADR